MLRSVDPSTGEVVGEVEVTDVGAIPALVAKARAAQGSWAEWPVEKRYQALRAVGRALQERRERLAELITSEMGKPLREARQEVAQCLDGFEQQLDEVKGALREEVTDNGRIRTTVYRDPFGVVACITPWNFPILMPHQGFLPALLAGNVVLYKPSEEVPLTGQAYAEVYAQMLPDGVVQIVHGADDQGKALVAADVDLIVFTGSRAAGKHILGQASAELKRVILELGGKDPLIVLDDADLDAAARFAARNSFKNAGQVCVSTERIYVEAGVHDAFVEAFQQHAQKMKVGDGRDPETRVGPMVNAQQRAHVVRQISLAVENGAEIAWQGAPRHGNFLAPTLLIGVDHGMEIARDETFGPVAAVMKVATEEQAVQLANDTPYGLGAVVFGESDRARRVARRLTAGMIGINQGLATAGPAPWVGARQSGYGFHSGRDGHRQFAQVRVVNERVA